MKFRKNKQTFESIQKRISELRYQIDKDKLELAEQLALLEQYKVDVEITTRSIKDDLGVTPKLGWL